MSHPAARPLFSGIRSHARASGPGLLLLSLVLVIMLPLLGASAPDLSWIEGLYDDGDNDLAFWTADSQSALVDGPLTLRPAQMFLPCAPATSRAIPVTALRASPTRSPPFSALSVSS